MANSHLFIADLAPTNRSINTWAPLRTRKSRDDPRCFSIALGLKVNGSDRYRHPFGASTAEKGSPDATSGACTAVKEAHASTS